MCGVCVRFSGSLSLPWALSELTWGSMRPGCLNGRRKKVVLISYGQPTGWHVDRLGDFPQLSDEWLLKRESRRLASTVRTP